MAMGSNRGATLGANTYTGDQTTTGNLVAGAAAIIGFTGRARLSSPVDSRLLLTNAAGTNFDMLQFGGTSASEVALKRNGVTLQARLANDSADCSFTAGSCVFSGSSVYSQANAGPTLKRGANGRVGTFICNGATPVTVNNTSIAVTDAIIISLNTVGGTVGALPAIQTITASTGFTVAGTASDTSTYNYAIIRNAA